ncbi:MAG: prepilin peptidase [Dorea sp.]|jgi:leader peptidase (prepilin peptidase)/N-methyltransferase|nr:prepilin peptidase [Dorea sp.]
MRIILLLFLFVLILVSYQDRKSMEIKDGCHIMILLLAVMEIFDEPEMGILSRLLGALCISAPMLVLALLVTGAFGGGDIKLMAAAGLFLGWKSTIIAAVIAVFAAGVYAAFLIIRKKAGKRSSFALGPFLCAGLAVSALWGEELWQLWQSW